MAELNRQFAIGYLSGLVDGEGCITWAPHSRTGRMHSRQIRIVNTDAAILDRAQQALMLLGVRSQRYLQANGLGHLVVSNKAGVRLLAGVLDLTPIKAEKLGAMAASYLSDEERHTVFVAAGRKARKAVAHG